jgi:hypothetical protein
LGGGDVGPGEERGSFGSEAFSEESRLMILSEEEWQTPPLLYDYGGWR